MSPIAGAQGANRRVFDCYAANRQAEASGTDFKYDTVVMAMTIAAVVGPTAVLAATIPSAILAPMAAITVTPVSPTIVIGVGVPARSMVLDQNDVRGI